MALHQILVNVAGKNITVVPTRLFITGGNGEQTLRWSAAPNDARITSIAFDDPSAPVVVTPENGDWIGRWNSDSAASIWKYSVTVELAGKPLPILDPEVENGPPGGTEIDNGGGPGGGG